MFTVGEHKREQDEVVLTDHVLDSLGGKMFIETNKGLRNVSYLKEVASYGGLFGGDLPALLKFVYPDGTVEYALRNGGWVIV